MRRQRELLPTSVACSAIVCLGILGALSCSSSSSSALPVLGGPTDSSSSSDADTASPSLPGCETISTSATSNVESMCSLGVPKERVVVCGETDADLGGLHCTPIEGSQPYDADVSKRGFCCPF